jgi:hypothetical protein
MPQHSDVQPKSKNQRSVSRSDLETRCSSRVTSSEIPTRGLTGAPLSRSRGMNSKIFGKDTVSESYAVDSLLSANEKTVDTRKFEDMDLSEDVQWFIPPSVSQFERWMSFATHLASRPTKPICVIPKIERDSRPEHLTPLPPGRACEDSKKDHSIVFEHRLFRRKNCLPSRRRFIERGSEYYPPDPLIAALLAGDLDLTFDSDQVFSD